MIEPGPEKKEKTPANNMILDNPQPPRNIILHPNPKLHGVRSYFQRFSFRSENHLYCRLTLVERTSSIYSITCHSKL